MTERLRIGVAGAGAIGCWVGGALAAAGADVVLVGRPRIVDEIATHGLTLEDLHGAPRRVPAARIALATALADLAPCDVVLVCVKSADTASVARELAPVLAPDAVVVSLQNGVRNPDILREALPGRVVVPGVVSFNVVARGDGVFRRATSGPVMLGGDHARPLARLLDDAGVGAELHADLRPHQWAKLVINLNNAVSALSGAPTRELLLSPGYRRVIAALVDEALRVLRAAGIRPAPMRKVPLAVMTRVLRLPGPLARLALRSQVKVDPEARSSMWQDLTLGRRTEIDQLNGEIVRLATAHGTDAPLNRRVVDLVHEAERAAAGSPNLAADALWTRLRATA